MCPEVPLTITPFRVTVVSECTYCSFTISDVAKGLVGSAVYVVSVKTILFVSLSVPIAGINLLEYLESLIK